MIGSLGHGVLNEYRTGGTDSLTWRTRAAIGGGLFALGVFVSFAFGWTHVYGHPAVYALGILTVLAGSYVAHWGGSLTITIGVATSTPLALFGYVGALRLLGFLYPQVIPWTAPIFALSFGIVSGSIAYLLGGGVKRFGSRAAA